MSVTWNPSAVSAIESTKATQRTLAPLIVCAAVLFNFALCFVDTKLFSISSRVVISCEIGVIATAFGLIWYRGTAFYVILSFLGVYLFTVMLTRYDFDPKLVRDLLIPITFYFLGSYLGSVSQCDKLVAFLIFLVLGVGLFECVALDTYLHYFDVIQYYVARADGHDANLQRGMSVGLSITSSDTGAGLYINSTRFEERTFLSFLGPHRVSGIFLEPISVGNFGATAFAWVLVRRRSGVWSLVGQLLAIAIILMLADARFGLYLCIITIVIYLLTPLIRPTVLFLAPFLWMVTLALYAAINPQGMVDNTIAGRFLGTGSSLLKFDLLQVLGLQATEALGLSGYQGDSGYEYVLTNIGLLGFAAIWALFVYSPPRDMDAWRFKNFTAFYAVLLLSISASIFSIKTAALLWFLYGTLNNQERFSIALRK